MFLSSFLAATVLPLSSEVVLSVVLANQYPLAVSILFATLGNWLGGAAVMDWDVWESGLCCNVFWSPRASSQKMKAKISRWGSALALLCWLPVVGDLFAVGLGFFRIDFVKVSLWMLVGKLLRYVLWGILTLWGINFFSFTKKINE